MQIQRNKILTLMLKPKPLMWKSVQWYGRQVGSLYDATKLDKLGFGKCANVITNVMMERLAAVRWSHQRRNCPALRWEKG